jgi:nicotinate phosphoribosyltransferase
MKSLLDNDLYKFTMMQAVWLAQPDAMVRYQFINRRGSDEFTQTCVDLIQQRVRDLCACQLTQEELAFLAGLNFMKPEFIKFLESFQLKEEHVKISFEDGQLVLWVEGSWVDTILWEVPLMAIISQSYFETVDTTWGQDLNAYYDMTLVKGQRLTEAQCNYIDFGTRRRRSYDVQDAVVRAFNHESVNCFGTSNVHFAMKHGMTPVGTMAHEWIMGHAGIFGVEDANVQALRAWRDVYGDELGVALTDTYTTELFFDNISGELAQNYAALRHDSECPLTFTDKVLNFYEGQGIDARDKTIVFSDSLSVDKAIEIQNYIADRIKISFGIGTHFTNHFEGSHALNIVIKLYEINGTKVVKISDNPGKASGHPDAVKQALNLIQGELV